MRITDFDLYKDLLKERSGLVITPDKSYLLDSRLTPVAKKWGHANIDGLTAALRGVPNKEMVNDIVEAMTTNETSFFRDTRPFNNFKEAVLPYVLQNRKTSRRLRIWCAASSSGQEPYSLSMLLKDIEAQIYGWNIDILATDISHEILAQAREGMFSQFEVQRGLPIQMLMKFFTQKDEKWRINDDVRKIIRFQYFNLLESMAMLGPFDVIFCRNVLIYFDDSTKKRVLENMAQRMEKDGFLFLGGAETVLGITDVFKPLPGRQGVYVLKDSVHLQSPPTGTAAGTLPGAGTSQILAR